MPIDKTKLQEPKNTEGNREILAETILRDMSTKQMREYVKERFMASFKTSSRHFSSEYWRYYEETHGHCPFGLNGN
jgi:hypothetical protein